jgi:hypothetical protein
MNLQRLVAMYGAEPFTTAQACRELGAGLSQPPAVRSLGNELRAAVGRPFEFGPKRIVLQRVGTVHNRRSRWQFSLTTLGATERPLAPSEYADPDGDLV